MFVVDASNHQRFEEARLELGKLLCEKNLKEAAMLVIANKQVCEQTRTNQKVVGSNPVYASFSFLMISKQCFLN